LIREIVMSWTNERVEQLKSLWTEGQSASAIAAELGEVTRNAVIGKIHRLGLTGRSPTSHRQQAARSSPASRRPRRRAALAAKTRTRGSSPKTATATLIELGPAPDIAVTVATLSQHTCRWPEGDPNSAGFHFCGRSTSAPGPYCAAHAAVAYQRTRAMSRPASTAGTR
jgi:GcrA cell cycle regulator